MNSGSFVCVASMYARWSIARMRREYIHYNEVGPQTAEAPRIMEEECNFRNENMRRVEVNGVCATAIWATCSEALLG